MPSDLVAPELEPVADGPGEREGDPGGWLEKAASAASATSPGFIPRPPGITGRLEEARTGVMVALFPDPETAGELAIDGGEPAEEIHLTLAFLGDSDGQGRTQRALLTAVRRWAESCPPLEGEVSGVGLFTGGPQPVTYASVDLPALPARREALVRSLDRAGFPPARDHGFTPHMTLAYASRRPDPSPRPIRFERVTVAWADERHSFPLEGRPPEELDEAALRLLEAYWDPEDHPRWPKGTPRGGEFMRVGQVFESGGATWEIAHIVNGKVVTHRADGKTTTAETRVFDPKETAGADDVLGGVKAAKPRNIKGGKKGSNVTVVDPYVDHESHDPAIPAPAESSVSAEEWQRFGALDQEHYAELMKRFGKHSPGGASKLIGAAYKDYEGAVQQLVKSAFSSQYGSSTGYTLSLTSIFKAFAGKKSQTDLEKINAQRERALELQGRLKDVYAWDLYNRTRSPDVALFHKDGQHPASWWKSQFIDGEEPVMSGLSQSFHWRASFFGSHTFATPMAVRHVVMSTYSAQPIPGQHHFPSELEVAIATQFKADKRSMAFSNTDLTPTQRKWLEQVTGQPMGGATIEKFSEAFAGDLDLPMPPAPAEVHLAGEGGKTWVDPDPGAADVPGVDDKDLPEIAQQAHAPKDLPKAVPWEHLDDDGLPEARVAKDAGYKPGDYMMGMKGTLYWVGPDPGDSSGFGLRYHKIVDGKFNGESWTFEGGGANSYYKIKGNHPPPKPEDDSIPEFDHAGWVNSAEPQFVSKLSPGDKFKVHGNPYEVVQKLNASQTQIRHLENGLLGTINNDYKTPTLEPKAGYVPPGALQPGKGMTFAHEGKKHTITRVLKDGTVSARPAGGGPVAKFEAGHEALEGIHDPAGWTVGEKIKAGDLGVGQVFHGGRGAAQRPYRVLEHKGSKVRWVNLDTGEEGESSKQKVFRELTPADEAGEDPATEAVPYDELAKGDPVAIGALQAGDQFTAGGKLYQVVSTAPDEQEGNATVAMILGGGLGAHTDAGSFPGKTVDFHAKAADPKPSAVDYALAGKQADDLPDISAGFDAYKSSHGPGGKYKHHKIAEMGEGTVFRDKGGKLWKVKLTGAAPVVTDGSKNYAVSGSLRGRALEGEEMLDSSPPLASGDAEVPEVAAAVGMVPNEGASLDELPVGTVFQTAEGEVFEVKELATKSQFPQVGHSGSSAKANMNGGYVPEKVKLPDKGPAEPDSIAALPPGATFSGGDGEPHEVVAHGGEGTVVKHVGSGKLSQLPPDTPTDEVAGPPAAPNTLAALGPGAAFSSNGEPWEVYEQGDGGTTVLNVANDVMEVWPSSTEVDPPVAPEPPEASWFPGQPLSALEPGYVYKPGTDERFTVVAQAGDGDTVVQTPGGLKKLPGDTPAFKVSKPADELAAAQPPEPKGLGGAFASEHGVDLASLLAAPLQAYKSKWGSGGKYQHHRLDELDAGDQFRDKTGTIWTTIDVNPDGTLLVRLPDGSYQIISDLGQRVRKL